jgi:hypothetical protein
VDAAMAERLRERCVHRVAFLTCFFHSRTSRGNANRKTKSFLFIYFINLTLSTQCDLN